MAVVAIDGPAGAGKSTVSRELAKALGFAYLDTGALYRAVGLAAFGQEVDPDDPGDLTAWLAGLDLSARAQGGKFLVTLDGRDVEPEIRAEHIGELASRLSARPEVRAALLDLQRQAAQAGDLVAEGRDMGTVVFPGAEVKIFLKASDQERARRRHQELVQNGQQVDFDEVLADMRRRDQRDQQRAASPLKPAPEAVQVDSSQMTRAEVVQRILDLARRRLNIE